MVCATSRVFAESVQTPWLSLQQSLLATQFGSRVDAYLESGIQGDSTACADGWLLAVELPVAELHLR